ncbi:hypothetical protein Sste5346_002077 [Sporothrix stenoceras]|uniref:Uncharacterized protein n=1 Tax=Sporothrix stenoceras TaxID=5173 RepID=A0ABR3ZJW7_9PEZI
MAPRGRPPGRKNGSSLGAAQLQSTPKSTPKTAAAPSTAPTKKTTTSTSITSANSTAATPQAAAASAAATPQTSQATPSGKKPAAKKGKLGRPAKGTPRSTNATPASASAAAAANAAAVATPATPATTAAANEIHVIPLSEILASEPVAESIERADEQDPVPMDTANNQPNGTAHAAEQSVLPDESRIADEKETSVIAEDATVISTVPVVTQPTRGRPPNSSRIGKHGPLGYTAANVDLEVITYRQLSEDVDAYTIDLDFCTSQLAQDDLTPQEFRTLQLRVLDLSHQIRHCQHRKEGLEAQRALKGGRPLTRPVPSAPRVSTAGNLLAASATLNANGRRPVPNKRTLSATGFENNGAVGGPVKRARAASEVSLQDTISMHSDSSPAANGNSNGAVTNGHNDVGNHSDIEMVHYTGGGNSNGNGNGHTSFVGNDSYLAKTEDEDNSSMTVRRLGFWKCRLCVSEKYLYAGPDRLPANPSKWPLKDMGKLMSHYFDLHTEHEPEERCVELGDALDDNRGPFEHWLRKSRAQKIPDRSIIDETISELQGGRVPKLLRDLCRAAAAFPGA